MKQVDEIRSRTRKDTLKMANALDAVLGVARGYDKEAAEYRAYAKEHYYPNEPSEGKSWNLNRAAEADEHANAIRQAITEALA